MKVIEDGKDRDFPSTVPIILALRDTEELVDFSQFKKVVSKYQALDWILTYMTSKKMAMQTLVNNGNNANNNQQNENRQIKASVIFKIDDNLIGTAQFTQNNNEAARDISKEIKTRKSIDLFNKDYGLKSNEIKFGTLPVEVN